MFNHYFDRRPADEDAAVRAEAEDIRRLDALAQDHADFTIAPGQENIVRALEAWSWLGLPPALQPILVNAFGEIFFLQDRAVVMLDTLAGALQPVAADLATFTLMLDAEEGQDDLLVAGLVVRLQEHGELLGADECYDYILAPIEGGGFDLDNIEVVDFVAKHITAADLHREIAEAAQAQPPAPPPA